MSKLAVSEDLRASSSPSEERGLKAEESVELRVLESLGGCRLGALQRPLAAQRRARAASMVGGAGLRSSQG